MVGEEGGPGQGGQGGQNGVSGAGGSAGAPGEPGDDGGADGGVDGGADAGGADGADAGADGGGVADGGADTDNGSGGGSSSAEGSLRLNPPSVSERSQNLSGRARPCRHRRAQGFGFTYCGQCGVRRDAVSEAEACVPAHLHCRQRTCATCARFPASVEYGGLTVSQWPPASASERLPVPLAAIEDAATASLPRHLICTSTAKLRRALQDSKRPRRRRRSNLGHGSFLRCFMPNETDKKQSLSKTAPEMCLRLWTENCTAESTQSCAYNQRDSSLDPGPSESTRCEIRCACRRGSASGAPGQPDCRPSDDSPGVHSKQGDLHTQIA